MVNIQPETEVRGRGRGVYVQHYNTALDTVAARMCFT